MGIRYFIGIDVSKATLDWAVFDGENIVYQGQSPNSETGIKAAVKAVKTLPGFSVAQSVCCMEHTGIYNAHALCWLHQLGFPLWLENSLQIKRSGGVQRGKSDAVDAARIAEYSFRFRDRLRLWQPPRPVIQKLAYLSALRQRLSVARQQLAQPLAEQQDFIDKAVSQQMSRVCRASLKALDADMASAERRISELIRQDERLSELFELVTSVPGLGGATAAEVFVATNEFRDISEPKKLACHAGIAPFEHRSGTSVRGRTRVSQHARKRLKSLFHMGAMSAIQVKGEMRDYYLRKVGEGKNKMSVLNAVRNKLVHRMCSVVHRGQKYEKIYTPGFA